MSKTSLANGETQVSWKLKSYAENGKITYEELTDHLQIAQAYILDSDFDAREYCAMLSIHI